MKVRGWIVMQLFVVCATASLVDEHGKQECSWGKIYVFRIAEELAWGNACHFLDRFLTCWPRLLPIMRDPILDNYHGDAFRSVDQFALLRLLYERLQNTKCVTDRLDEASLVLVPVHLGSITGVNRGENTQSVWDYVTHALRTGYEGPLRGGGTTPVAAQLRTTVKWLKTQPDGPLYAIHRLRNVLAITGTIAGLLRQDPPSCTQPACLGMASVYTLEMGRPGSRIQAVPYPGPVYFDSRHSIQHYLSAVRIQPRPIAFSFAGRPRQPGFTSFTRFRGEVIEVCRAAKDCQTELGITDRAGREKSGFLGLYARSEFCLQPAGDSRTRRGIFDSLALGCIPIVHQDAIGAYSLHISDPAAVAIVARDPGASGFQEAMHRARQMTSAEKASMRQAIAELLPALTYALGDVDYVDAFKILLDNAYNRTRPSR
mmetsp:Transcript_25767/g.72170  ORF Transcript_25767/g.72170 Transcript_25767/m.72170 type:complete len:429 (+) Transcript_25767:103-1389(+)